jgi:hypothetical protein
MGYCDGLIGQDIKIDCKDLIVPGIEANGVIINYEDVNWDTGVTRNSTRENVVETFTLKTGKRGYKIAIPVKQPFSGTTTTMEAGTIRNTFTNNVGFVILANDPDVVREVIDGLANGKFVVVFENRYKNLRATHPGDSTFQIMGMLQGLVAATLENDKYSEDTQGGWNVVLTETGAPEGALFLYNTDLPTTRDMFDSLTNPVAG